MVSEARTELERGVVQWKPEPKPMPDVGNGPWTSYQIKVNDKYFDCNQTIYQTVRKDDDIEFTFTSKPWSSAGGKSGVNRKIQDLISGSVVEDEARGGVETDKYYDNDGNLHEYPSWQPRSQPSRSAVGTIDSLQGAEVGAMENRAVQIAVSRGTTLIEDIKAILMDQAFLGSWFKAQPIPSVDEEPTDGYAAHRREEMEKAGLVHQDEPVWNEPESGPPWEGDEPPDNSDIAEV